MSIEELCDHTCRVLRRTEDQGEHLDTEVTYSVPAGLEAVPCTFTRRRSILSDNGTGLQASGQRRVFIPDVVLTFQNRDIIQVYAGPEGFQPIENLEVVSISKPRGHHTELVVEEYDGHIPTEES